MLEFIDLLADSNVHDSIISITNLVGYIAAACVGGTGYHFLKRVDKKQEPVNENCVKRSQKTVGDTISKNRIIQTFLADTRQRFSADRVLVFLYHNGEVFANGNHLLKVSCAFESLDQGVCSVSPWFLNLPYVIFRRWKVGSPTEPYIFQSDIDSEEYDPYLTQILANSGTETVYTLPINSEEGITIGFICVHYLRKTILSSEDVDAMTKVPSKIYRILSVEKLSALQESKEDSKN